MRGPHQEELTRLNSELVRWPRATAEDANISKTRFLAAASHDILQPLGTARLYVHEAWSSARMAARICAGWL